jgi:hypothetical protein
MKDQDKVNDSATRRRAGEGAEGCASVVEGRASSHAPSRFVHKIPLTAPLRGVAFRAIGGCK